MASSIAYPDPYIPELPYLDSLTYPFQDYFYKHIRRALTFFVEATVQDVFDYMRTVLTQGPRNAYASDRFLTTTANRRRLRNSVYYALELLRDRGEIDRHRVERRNLYFIPEIWPAHDHRYMISGMIFNILRQYGVAERIQIQHHLAEDGEVYDQAVMMDLINLGCVLVEVVGHRPRYQINMN
ncbi:hypothetical protein HA402_009161 [Bradysia odoriphaga]|nr:hypothetical protein HA402_009161 [Bradysia odoriphaga]